MARARRPYVQWFARAGYAARGIVFVILAYFTATAAIYAHRQPVGGKDALRSLLTAPLGSALLALLTVGLLCFALWREAQFIVVFAALQSRPHEATGLGGALMAIKDQPYGGVLLGITALGLLAFGAYGLAEAVYRRIDGRRITSRVPSWLSV